MLNAIIYHYTLNGKAGQNIRSARASICGSADPWVGELRVEVKEHRQAGEYRATALLVHYPKSIRAPR